MTLCWDHCALVCASASVLSPSRTGGEGKVGKVVDIRGWDQESGRSVASVTWSNGTTNVYRMGHKGKVDLKYVSDGQGGYYYKEHLPKLGVNGGKGLLWTSIASYVFLKISKISTYPHLKCIWFTLSLVSCYTARLLLCSDAKRRKKKHSSEHYHRVHANKLHKHIYLLYKWMARITSVGYKNKMDIIMT